MAEKPIEDAVAQRMLDQLEKRHLKMKFPKGRIDKDDDGAVAIAIAADKKHGCVIIDFCKQLSWIGLHQPEIVSGNLLA